MTILLYLKLFIIALVVFFTIDLLWLSVFAKKIYDKELKPLLNEKVKWIPAIIFYILFLIGLIYFAIYPAVQSGDILTALINGGLFGLVSYATYDLTNLATLKNWPKKITIIDLIWGTTLSIIVSVVTFLLG